MLSIFDRSYAFSNFCFLFGTGGQFVEWGRFAEVITRLFNTELAAQMAAVSDQTIDKFVLFTIPSVGSVDLDVIMKLICCILTVIGFIHNMRRNPDGD